MSKHTLCPECHHLPSCRLRPEYAGCQCNCECHCIADAGPEMLAALEAADAVMEAAVLRGIQDWLGEGPSMVWASAHQQVRAALEKARGKS